MKDSVIRPRPSVVTVIAVLLLISGVIGLAVNIFYMTGFAALSALPNLPVSALEIAFSVLYLIVALGLLSLEEHARKLGIIILTAGVIFRLGVLAIQITYGKPILESVTNIYIVIYLVCVIYLRKPETRRAFASKTGSTREPQTAPS